MGWESYCVTDHKDECKYFRSIRLCMRNRVGQTAGCQTLLPLTLEVAAVSCVTGSGPNFSAKTASFERYSSMPM